MYDRCTSLNQIVKGGLVPFMQNSEATYWSGKPALNGQCGRSFRVFPNNWHAQDKSQMVVLELPISHEFSHGLLMICIHLKHLWMFSHKIYSDPKSCPSGVVSHTPSFQFILYGSVKEKSAIYVAQ